MFFLFTSFIIVNCVLLTNTKIMREIKFRVWDSISTAYHYWGNIQNNKFNDFDLEHYTLEQFTGLKDKNGVDIYEGDIIKAYHEEFERTDKAVVFFDNGAYMLYEALKNGSKRALRYWNDGTHDWYSIEQYDNFNLEVIGNIHENE